jgi:hypothetical protein
MEEKEEKRGGGEHEGSGGRRMKEDGRKGIQKDSRRIVGGWVRT